MTSRARRTRPGPLARALLALAVVGPALALGGVPPIIVPVFTALALALLVSVSARRGSLEWPRGAWIGLLAAGVTFLQWLPLPPALRDALAPGLAADVHAALVGTAARWRQLSVLPGATGLEAARLVALTALFVAAARFSWRRVAAHVAVAGALVSVVGLLQKLLGLHRIYGVYAPRDRDPAASPALLTSFVNPNQQSALMLLACFAAAALALDLRQRAAARPEARDRLHDRALLAVAAGAVALVGLALSLSRGAFLTLAVTAPLAGLLARGRGGARPQRSVTLTALALGVLSLGAYAVSRGMLTALVAETPDAALVEKLRPAREALALLGRSPWLGIGRGAFMELRSLLHAGAGATDSATVYTHIETAPVTMLVEWGPLAGGAVLVGLTAWWFATLRAARHPGERVALCGLLAIAAHGLVDFSLEFLGVAAPVCALAGALGQRRSTRLHGPRRRLALALGVALLVGAAALSLRAAPHTFWSREADVASARQRHASADASLSWRPLDGALHLALARVAAEDGRWRDAATRAEVAARLLPASVDARIVGAVATRQLGEADEDAAVALDHAALARLRAPPSPDFVDYLVARYPDPRRFAAALVPDEPEAWRALFTGLAERAPRYAEAVARERGRAGPDDPDVLARRVELALAADNPALAYHLARLLAHRRPRAAESHLLVVKTLAALRPADHGERQEHLERALAAGVDDPGALEERWLALWVHADEVDARGVQARVESMLRRPAPRETRGRRERLARRVRDRLARG